MFSFLFQIFLLTTQLHLAAAVSGQTCSCSSVVVPVHVNTLIAKDPADPFGGLQSNATDLRPLNQTYDIFGVFCAPTEKPTESRDVVQLLVHGFSYTNQYWSPAGEEFHNQSYTAYACERDLSTFAVDLVGVGKSTRPANASGVQFATYSAVVSRLARHLKSASIFLGVKPFKKVIGMGHSAGSVALNHGAIAEAKHSPFDGLILTSRLIFQPGKLSTPGTVSARDDTPLRWGSLDPNYATNSAARPLFYPTDPSLFSPRMVDYDGFTKDVATASLLVGVSISSLTANYPGPVVKVVGVQD